MKRFFAVILAVLMLAAVLCACGSKPAATEAVGDTDNAVTPAATEAAPLEDVKTTVDAKYDDGFAKNYASDVKTDDDGNTTYEFSGESFEEFSYDYKNTIGSDIASELAEKHGGSYGQFAYIKEDTHEVIIGLNEGEYDEATAAEEAKIAADNAFKYFYNLGESVDSVSVVYCFANDQSVVYGTFEIAAE